MDPSKNFTSLLCAHFNKTSSRLKARHDDTKKTRLQAQKHHHHHYHHRVALFPRPFSRVCRGAQSERVSILRYFIVGAHKMCSYFLTSFFRLYKNAMMFIDLRRRLRSASRGGRATRGRRATRTMGKETAPRKRRTIHPERRLPIDARYVSLF